MTTDKLSRLHSIKVQSAVNDQGPLTSIAPKDLMWMFDELEKAWQNIAMAVDALEKITTLTGMASDPNECTVFTAKNALEKLKGE